MFHSLNIHFRLRKLLLVAGKLWSKCETFGSTFSGNDLLLVLLLRIPPADSVDVLVVLLDDEDTCACGDGDLFAIFLRALRLACGVCVSECSCSSGKGGDVDVFRRSIAGRSRFSPFTLLFSMLFVGPFCTGFRPFLGVDNVKDDEFCRLARRPFSGRGLDTLLDIDDFRDDDRDDTLL